MNWLWRIIKFIGYLIIALIAIALIWAAAAWLHGDDKLNPEFASFYVVDMSRAYEGNGAIAALGLSAPADVVDTYSWALNILKQVDAEKKKFLAHLKGEITPSSFDAGERLITSISQVENIPNRVEFIGDTRAIGCFQGQQYRFNGEPFPSQCDEKALPKLMSDNALLLKRYQVMLGYNRYDDYWPITGLNGSALIKLQEVYVARLVEMSKTNPEAALQQALANMRFYRRALTGHTNLIARSILMVNYGLVQKSLPTILGNNEALIAAQLNQLFDAFSPFSANEVNVAELAKAEYELLSTIFEQLGNHNKNKMLQFHKDFIAAWNTPPIHADAAWAPFFKRYKSKELHCYLNLSDWHSPRLSITANLVISGMAVGGDLSRAQNAIDARSRILNLYVQIKTLGIAPAEIQAFLNNAPKALYNPFTETPMNYDAASNSIYFTRTDGIKEGFVLK